MIGRQVLRDRIVALLSRASGSRVFVRLGSRVFPRVDGAVHRLSGGRVTVAELVVPTLVLTTTGRRSGEPRSVPLATLDDGDGWLVVGSNFGQAHPPAWVLNLLADPRARVRRRGRTHAVEADLLDDEERARVWPRLVERWPAYDDYVSRAGAAGRELCVFRLRRV